MKESKIIEGIKWVPMHLRGGSPRKPDPGLAAFWLTPMGQGELYFVNSSDETLEGVWADSGGFQTVDDAMVTVSSDTGYEYSQVKPGDAVKVDQYDDFYDLDYVIKVYIRVKSHKFGFMELRSPSAKGGLKRDTVLLWDTGEPGPHAVVVPLSEEEAE